MGSAIRGPMWRVKSGFITSVSMIASRIRNTAAVAT